MAGSSAPECRLADWTWRVHRGPWKNVLSQSSGFRRKYSKPSIKWASRKRRPSRRRLFRRCWTGRDVVGQSATGSGKTVAFAIPAIERVDPKIRAVQVLILCPTRELAVQVAEETGKIAHFKSGVTGVPIYGGQSYDRQFRALAAGVQVVIGTPGRVMDHMERGTLELDALKMVVLDEADRMLDMGFRDDIEKVLRRVPEERQLLFFSATMPRAIQELIKRYSRDPAWIKIEPGRKTRRRWSRCISRWTAVRRSRR